MQYGASVPFRGDRDRAFGLAESALTALGFQVTERTSRALTLSGPGMHSTRQSALLAASRIHIVGNHGELAVEAELGGAAWMSRFVTLFPLGLVLFLGIVLSTVFSVLFGCGIWLVGVALAVGGNTMLWLLLGPWMAKGIQARTARALDALLSNMVSAGQAS